MASNDTGDAGSTSPIGGAASGDHMREQVGGLDPWLDTSNMSADEVVDEVLSRADKASSTSTT